MEKLIKVTGNFKMAQELDGVQVAHSKLKSWWKTDLQIYREDDLYATISKDSFWSWNCTVSLSKENERYFSFKAGWLSNVSILSGAGEEFVFERKWSSDNLLTVINAAGEEVLKLQKEGKWWKWRPYRVILEDSSKWPVQDEIFPLMLVSSLGIFNQRGALIGMLPAILGAFINKFY